MPKAPTKITAARALYMLDRAMREQLLDYAFGTAQLARSTEYFRMAGVAGCIYCDSPHVERWDHLVSVYAGGATVVGNMVPACQPCDDSKGSKDYRAWLSGSAPRNPARANPSLREKIVRRIEAYQQHFTYIPPENFSAALTEGQRSQYSAFCDLHTEFRSRLATFGLVTPSVEDIDDDDNSESDEV